MSSNRLEETKSPYLLQHADNPVDWYPWEVEAFEKARKEDKPVFLSIGYATCHWCHVMAHESFEDPEVAELLNNAFVNIKVDREERPDIDNTYMTVCQMLSGRGGWPLSIFMTPDKKPFYAATYIPKRGRFGRPGLMELVPRLKELWEEDREKIYDSAGEIASAFQQSLETDTGESLDESVLNDAYQAFFGQFDSENGGFGSAPKFPSAHNLVFLLRYGRLYGQEDAVAMVEKTLTQLRLGGIFDQVGYGFHRYSTDARWLVPHFEKMLYDQAMLLNAYCEAWQATKNPLFRQTAEEIVEYVARDLRSDRGGFYSAEDADTEGEEGKFYVWDIDEIRITLDEEEAELAAEVYNLKEEGNYREEAGGGLTGKNILHLEQTLSRLAEKHDLSAKQFKAKLALINEKLLKQRSKRERPLLDDKILTDWNGLMIASLAKSARTLGDSEHLNLAVNAANFILDELNTEEGLMHRFREGEAAIPAFADDYAFLIWGLLELYETTFEIDYLRKARELNTHFIENFWDNGTGGFYFTDENHETLMGRKKEWFDGAMPSGNSVAMNNLLKLGRLTEQDELEQMADQLSQAYSGMVKASPTGFGQALQAVLFATGTTYEIVIAGEKKSDQTRKMVDRLRDLYIPNRVLLLKEPGDTSIEKIAPFTKNQTTVDGKTALYICRNYSCRSPVTEPGKIEESLKTG